MGKIADVKLDAINAVGEEDIFHRIATGTSVTDVIAELNVGWKLWARWLDSAQGRRERYTEAMEAAGHFYAARAVKTAQQADIGSVNVARLQVDTDKWIAAKMNQQYDVRQRDVAINISVNDLHAQAAALLNEVNVIDGEAVEVEGDEGE